VILALYHSVVEIRPHSPLSYNSAKLFSLVYLLVLVLWQIRFMFLFNHSHQQCFQTTVFCWEALSQPLCTEPKVTIPLITRDHSHNISLGSNIFTCSQKRCEYSVLTATGRFKVFENQLLLTDWLFLQYFVDLIGWSLIVELCQCNKSSKLCYRKKDNPVNWKIF